jgi:hypothetical protein
MSSLALRLFLAVIVLCLLSARPVSAAPISIDFADNVGPLDSGVVDLAFNSPGPGVGTLTFDLIGYLTVDGANTEHDSFFLSINGPRGNFLDGVFRMGGGGPPIIIDFIVPGVTIVSHTDNGPGLGGLTQLSALFNIRAGVNIIRFEYLMVGAGLADEGWGFENAQVRGNVVPEPGAFALIGAGVVWCLRVRRRTRPRALHSA